MSRIGNAGIVGVMTAVLGLTAAVIPSVSALEDSLGLRLMFLVRGPLEPPASVAVISIDEAAGVRLGLPPLLRDWPRSVHGTLVDRLVERGVTAVAFDVEFFRHSPEAVEDERFAAAVGRARRVALVQRFEIARAGAGEIWERQNPVPRLADAALALAPVPLPDAPIVARFWSFISTPEAQEVPSLPAVTLQIAALPALPAFLDLLRHAGARGLEAIPNTGDGVRGADDLLVLMRTLRRTFGADRSLPDRLTALLESSADTPPQREREAIRALIGLYGGPSEAFINFYGPPGTICTIPYEDVLVGETPALVRCPLRGRAVFVGAGKSRVDRADQPDTYHTVYGSADGTDFSGVEIHATAFANLASGAALSSAGPALYAFVLALFGVAVGAGAYAIRTAKYRNSVLSPRFRAATATIVGALAYALLAYLAFAQLNRALPFAIPLFVQVPAALLMVLSLPAGARSELTEAVCLVTDAAGSTPMSERLDPASYSRLMRDYHEALCMPVRSRGGQTLNPKGDGFLCLWRSGTAGRAGQGVEAAVRLQACLAALEISEAAKRFNERRPPERRLHTRIGIDLGVVTVHSDSDRGPYDVQGHAPSVAERLQQLNPTLGTEVLASEAVVSELDGMLVLRKIDRPFTLKGVSHPPAVFEISGRRPSHAAPGGIVQFERIAES